MWYNPIIQWLLRSPLHFFVSNNMMLLTYTGRRSGKYYTTPVSYLSIDDVMYIMSSRDRIWWRNLRGGGKVTLRLRGKDIRAEAVSVEEQEQVVAHLRRYFLVAPQMIRYMHVETDPQGNVKTEQIEDLAREKVFVRIRPN